MKNNYRFSVLVFVVVALVVSALTLYVQKSSGKAKIEFVKRFSTDTQSATPNGPDQKLKDFGLKIEKLDLLVPVIKNVDGGNKAKYNDALQNGVAHFNGTGLPGEKNNIFIFGHSSSETKGDYSKIFAKLNDLEKGDEMIVYYENKERKYKVKEKKIVEATDLSVLDKTKKETLTLMTCWPIGTKDKRLIIVSDAL